MSKSWKEVYTLTGDINLRQVAFLSGHADPTGDSNIRWIGFKAFSITGEEKEFWWWRNSTDSIEQAKVFCGSLLAQHLIEAQIGPAIDLQSSQTKNHIEVINTTDEGKPIYGIYIESKHRPMFNLMLSIKGLKMPEKVKVKEGW